MSQLILHLIGDYVTQSDWMAQRKISSLWAAFVHGTVYSLPFLLIAGWRALLVIWITHILIDRYRLARYVVFAKNFIGSEGFLTMGVGSELFPKWEDCKATGYPSARPAWLAVWLLIAADNTIHLAINYMAIQCL